MKFGKILSHYMEEALPEWRDKFLSYKELKQRLKLIQPKGESERNKRRRLSEDAAENGAMTVEESDFILLLEGEVKKLNDFFVEKEEDYIIRQKEMQDRAAKAKESMAELICMRKLIVDFHGEMVLLANYSAINYTGLVKILKKYDKRTGALLRLPFIQKVLQEPFFNTDLLYKLVKGCEMMLDDVFAASEPSTSGGDEEGQGAKAPSERVEFLRERIELMEIEHMDSLYMRRTVSALRVLMEIRSGSSTVSAFSLPPLQNNILEDCWSRTTLLEQVAK